MRILLFTFLSLLTLNFAAHATAESEGPLRASQYSSRDNPYWHKLQFDFNFLNDLNRASLSMPQEKVNEAWRSFLTTSPIFSENEDITQYRHDNIGTLRMIIDGKIELPLLRAMFATHREDTDVFYKLAPTAIVGRDDKEAYRNKDIFYNCLVQSALSTVKNSYCENFEKLTTLNAQQYDDLKGAYIRIMRLGSLNFSHEFCESGDTEIVAISQATIKPNEFYKSIRSEIYTNLLFTYVRNEEAVKRFASLPFLGGKFNSPQLMRCKK